MREIRFRAWDANKKEMIYFTEFDLSFTNGFWEDKGVDNYCLEAIREAKNVGGYNHDDFNAYIRDKQFDLMQFIGLKDKAKKRIFEKDICIYHDSIPEDQEEFENSNYDAPYDGKCIDKPLVGLIEWDPESAGFRVGGTKWWSKKIEIIGNIYENPELLNQTKI